MAARACPRCKKPLVIPQPPPAKVQCAHCTAFIRLTAPSASKSSLDIQMSMHDLHDRPAPASATNPFELADDPNPTTTATIETPLLRHRSRSGGFLLAVMFVLLLCAGGAATAYYYNNRNKTPEQKQASGGLDVSALDRDTNSNVINPAAAVNNEAIARGVAYLQKQLLSGDKLYYRSQGLLPGNAHIGASALAGLTLLECGVGPQDPAVQRALAIVRDGEAATYSTYTLSIAIMFMDRLHQARALPKEDYPRITTYAKRLLAIQDADGFWGYGKGPAAVPVARVAVNEPDAPPSPQSPQPTHDSFRYVNFSNSMFAALALWTAKQHGVDVKQPLLKAARKVRQIQKSDGSWVYDPYYNMHHTSTCTGLIFLALEKGLEESVDHKRMPSFERMPAEPVRAKFDEKSVEPSSKIGKYMIDDPAVQKGLEFLGKWINRHGMVSEEKKKFRHGASEVIRKYYEESESTGNETAPGIQWTMDYAFSGTIFGADSWGDLYLLWSLECVGVTYDLKKIGGKDWHAWGSGIIVKHQLPDGSWKDRFPGVPDTCFALLFLKRANIAKYLTDKLQEMMARIEAAPPQQGRKE